MALQLHHVVCLLLVATTTANNQRWSRQISSYTADVSDWVPLTAPIEREPSPQKAPQIKRQAVAEPRILAEPTFTAFRPTSFAQDTFPPRNFYSAPTNNKLYLQTIPAVPSAPQNYLTDNGFGQGIRFGLSQPNFPLNQGFVAPQFTFDNVPAFKPRPQQNQGPANPVKFENYPKIHTNLPSPQAQPFINQQSHVSRKPEIPKFVDGYRAENYTNGFGLMSKKKPQLISKVKFESDKFPKSSAEVFTGVSKPKVEREEVQLLYVPVESLNRGSFNFRPPITSQQFSNNEQSYQHMVPNPQQQDFRDSSDFLRPISKPAAEHFGAGQEYIGNFNNQLNNFDQSKFSTIASPFPTHRSPTTPKPKKLKAHQPPLAIFVTEDSKKGSQVKVGDVLSYLKSSSTVAVLDSVSPQTAPKVFIGPNSLTPPQNYVKFELPYLSNLENTDKKLRQLPFFVAPLSYHTPQGFAKIPFPSPHVGSVVINAQIKDNQQPAPKQINDASSFAYSSPPKQEPNPAPQKPTFTYYTTSGPKSSQPHYDPNYYSIEPQSVSTVRPAKEETNIITAPPKPGTYFLNEPSQRYEPPEYVNFPESVKHPQVKPVKPLSRGPAPSTTTRTPSTTTTSTTTASSTYSSHLLETHNPYSINQAFHLSTPLDYHKYYDEYKEGYPGYNNPTLSTPAPPSSPSPKTVEVTTEKQSNQQQTSPAYLHSYSPEVHYESEVPNSRYPEYHTNNYNKPELTSQSNQPTRGSNKYSQLVNEENEDTRQDISVTKYTQPGTNTAHSQEVSGQTEYSQPQKSFAYNTNANNYAQANAENTYTPSTNANINNQQVQVSPNIIETPIQYNRNVESSASYENLTETVNYVPTAPSESESLPTKPDQYNQYETDFSSKAQETVTSTTTTRRPPLRTRGRPRYTTLRPESTESTTRSVVTRRPLRERRPLPTRPKYETNNISTEKSTRSSADSSETTTKSNLWRSRTRGRVQYKRKESDDIYNKRQKSTSKENDLAYQRDILHQNYPVTISERLTTQNADPVTEPLPRISSTRNIEPATEAYDSENAFTNEKISVSQQSFRTSSKEDSSSYPSRTEVRTERPYVPKLSTRKEEYTYQSRSSFAPIDAISSYDELTSGNDEDIPIKQTTSLPKSEEPETVTVPTYSYSESDDSKYPTSVAYSEKQEDLTTAADIETTKLVSQEVSTEGEPEFNVVQTTPSFSRVRVRPGVVRQQHPASSTEGSRAKIDRKRPVQAVTYRPAYSGRRTTMRIEEIEADLKTKQVLTRTQQDYKHPVYKPESTTPNPVTSSNLRETTTKQGHFRRRRPNYTTTSTEASSSKRTHEVNSRFRGRRPTTEKFEVQTDAPTSTTRTVQYSRYSNRPRLSERFNKKPEPEESEDQESNYSINRPKYVSLESDQWSPKLTSESFKPYNPNDIVDENKSTTERRSDVIQETEIITARNEYDDILLSVTPATNNKTPKKLADIPPTLEALVETSKNQHGESTDAMAKFETMLEEVMKSLEEQDENEYTTNVMKHKGGEIGEIPPEDAAPTDDSQKPTTVIQEEVTTAAPEAEETSSVIEEEESKGRRRGFWKKVKVRPVATEAIEAAESQYYTSTVNLLGQKVNTKNLHDKPFKQTAKIAVTTYKPTFNFLADIFESNDDLEAVPDIEITKVTKQEAEPELVRQTTVQAEETTEHILNTDIVPSNNPGDVDMGTGSPTVPENIYFNTPTETTTSDAETTLFDRTSGFSFMDYLFGATDNEEQKRQNSTVTETPPAVSNDVVITTVQTEATKPKLATTESTYIPEEITAETLPETSTETFDFSGNDDKNAKETEIVESTEKSVEKSVVRMESASESSFMDSANVMSTSMSTEISHETEICFRGKCIKTNKDLL